MKKKRVFKGKLLTLFLENVKLPNDHPVTLEVIKHPGAVLIIPFLGKDKLILLRQFRPVINSYIYELPAGTLDRKESLYSCAKREIIEETGYSARKLTRLGHVFPVPGYSTEKITIYKAENLRKTKQLLQKDEIISILVVTKAKVRSLFKKGKITDAKTISALAMCGWL